MVIGTGIDIIEVSRIETAIKRWGNSFLLHIFTDKEIEYSQNHKYPAQHFAVRFAAKEAVYKAIGEHPHISWKDIEILNDENGKPYCLFKDRFYKNKILISLSHTKDYAVANAIITTE